MNSLKEKPKTSDFWRHPLTGDASATKQEKSSLMKPFRERGCLFEMRRLARLTLPLLSDLPPHRFPDVCRFHASTRRPGNRSLFRQSWQQWFSQCWPGKWTSRPGIWGQLSDCRDLHSWELASLRTFIHSLKRFKNMFQINRLHFYFIFLEILTHLLIRGMSWTHQNQGAKALCTKDLSIKKQR